MFNLLQTVPDIPRDVTARLKNKEANRRISSQFGEAYFDGPREQGYGGYTYDGRWLAVARTATERYKLRSGQRVLDIGCAKGYFVHDLMQEVPGLDAVGLDISEYALREAKSEVAHRLQLGNAKELPYPDQSFEAVFAINTLHNLDRQDCIIALKEMKRVSKDPRHLFVQVDAYRDPAEKELFEAWMLTAKTYCMPEQWEALFEEAGYQGDYYYTILNPKTQASEEQQGTKEPQYNRILAYRQERGLESLGLMTSQAWYDDPKRLTFTLARYKFVAKMFAGRRHVLEVGCADAFGTRIVVAEVQKLTATDFEPHFIEDVQQRASQRWPFESLVHDMMSGPMPGAYDSAYALDVLEHIRPEDEDTFLRNMIAPLEAQGVVILGMPSLESQEYASPISKEGHVNCKTMPDFKALMERYFENVFMFSMNDEIVHTGYHKMAHYLIALCCTKKEYA